MKEKLIKIKDPVIGAFKFLTGLALFVWIGYAVYISFINGPDYETWEPDAPNYGFFQSIEDEVMDKSMIEHLQDKDYVIIAPLALLEYDFSYESLSF